MAHLFNPPSNIRLISLVLLSTSWLLPGAAFSVGDDHSPNQIQLVTQLAQAGRAQAQYSLGRLYLYGRGPEQDIEQGLNWLRKAADQNYGEAQNQLGLLYLTGGGVNMDCKIASHWFSSVAPDSNAYRQARSNLAWLLATCPEDSARDGQRAIEIVRQLLEQEPDNPSLLDTHAAALAETGQFEQAIETQQKAIALLTGQSAATQQQRFNSRLQHYQRNHPWRISPE